MSKIRKIFTSIMLIVALTTFWWFAPFTIKDPANPHYNPKTFSFRFYPRDEDAARAFAVLFPPGTSKDFVDKVLVGEGGAKIYDGYNVKSNYINSNIRMYVYSEPTIYLYKKMKEVQSYNFIFTSEMNLINIYVRGNGYIFRDFLLRDDALKMTVEETNNRIRVWRKNNGGL
ncbi:hypothetical protein [Altericroceibacterium spongiae]|uniref:hypothetical protein n=1 Tax=Altericroceibacterium spongiae TaxID=2320269 RepID=UPI0011C392AF|nr:hypothetical protein [Altericroceibacterium spongiae]